MNNNWFLINLLGQISEKKIIIIRITTEKENVKIVNSQIIFYK